MKPIEPGCLAITLPGRSPVGDHPGGKEVRVLCLHESACSCYRCGGQGQRWQIRGLSFGLRVACESVLMRIDGLPEAEKHECESVT